MMLKLISKGFLLAVMSGSVIILFMISLSAMLNGGIIRLDFNSLGEGWFEVAFLGLALIPSVIYVRKEIKKESLNYCKRQDLKNPKYRFRTTRDDDIGMAGQLKASPPASYPATIITHLNSGGWDQ